MTILRLSGCGLRGKETNGAPETNHDESHNVEIAKPLSEAIRHLRPEAGGPLFLWADFICIDQSNWLSEPAK